MSKKMTNCKACGAEIAKGATCPHCGAKNKKGCLPGVLAVFAVLVIVGMIGGGSESADNEVESTDVVQEEVQQTVEATEEETAGAETVDAATVMDLVRLSMVDAFDYYNIEGDETGFTIYVGFDGLATDTLMAKASGYDETYEPWAESRKAILSLHESTYELMETLGMENPSLMICVVNDTNTENILLATYMGEIVYDVMAE